MSEYRDVPGYQGDYQVSRNGLVRSLKRGVKVMSPAVARTGYWQINLYLSGKVKHHYVHRLVAEAWIGPIPDGFEVNHRDGDKSNNKVSNLEIVTARQNIHHAIALGLIPPVRGENSPRAKLKEDEVREIRRLKGTIRVGEVAKRFGVSERTVYCIWEGKTWRHVA
jgi:hypothetical protein